MAISALLVSLVARLASDYDKGRKLQIINTRELDENIWRALRFGLDGNLVDFKKQREVPVTDVIRELIEFTSVMHEKLGLKKYISSIAEILDDGNGAQKQIRLYEEKNDVGAVFSEVLESNPLI
jgi:carboxylate-amine ligase